MSDNATYRFLAGGKAEGFAANHKDDSKIALLACCIADQQRAGFKNAIDLREVRCEQCSAPGFNTGWGFWRFTCGHELLTDGTLATECRAAERGKP